MKSISEIMGNSKPVIDNIELFFKKYMGSTLLRRCGITKLVDEIVEGNVMKYHDNPILRMFGGEESAKESGLLKKVVSAKRLLIDKILLCFTCFSAYFMFKTDSFFGDYKKDTFYRFDRMEGANWERLQLEVAKNVIDDIDSHVKGNRINALAFDDSLYQRVRGKGTELCARVYDHTDHKQRMGYRMMTGAWVNGSVVIPFAQALLSTRDEKLMVGPDQAVDRRTLRWKRRNRAKTKGTAVVLEMVKEAQRAGIPFDYVLFDTWFSNPAQLLDLKAIGAETVAMIKKNSTKYTWTDATGSACKLDVREIYARNKKRRGRSRYLLSVEVVISDKEGRSRPARLVYVRNRSNRKEWICFVCTDLSLDENTILKIYTMRWGIETYFKVSKTYLKLRTECHSTSYDAITSHMVIVALRYMILAVAKFYNSADWTIEDLFFGIQQDLIQDKVDREIILLIDALLDSVRECFGATEQQMDNLVRNFINRLPRIWQERFSIPKAT